MTNDPKSAICVKCKKKNEVIEYMVSQKSGASADAKAQQEHYEHYNNNKNKPKGKV
jgi:hypothetical protein